MHWQINDYVFILFCSGIICLFVAVYTLVFLKGKQGFIYSLLMLCISFWSLICTLELSVIEPYYKILFSKISYISIVSIAPLWLLFAVSFSGLRKISRPQFWAMWIIPVVVLVLAFTNEYHKLVWPEITPAASYLGKILIYSHGPAKYLLAIYSYCLVLIGSIFLFRFIFYHPKLIKRQVYTMLLGIAIPWVVNILYVFNITLLPHFDLTPFAFSLTGIFFVLGIFRYRFLNIIPIARDTLFNNMEDCAIVINPKFDIVDTNDAVNKIIEQNDYIGKNIDNVFKQIKISEIIKEQAVISQESRTTEIKLNLRGKEICYDMKISPVYSYTLLTGYILIFRDISIRKEAEEKLIESENNLRELNQLKDKFFSIISHDLRSPFQGLLGLSDILRNEYDSLTKEEISTYIAELNNAIRTQYLFIEDLLNWSRIQSGIMNVNLERINIKNEMEKITEILRVNASNKDITIENNIPDGLECKADNNMFDLLFRNLISNAIKFTRKGGRIFLNASRVKSGICISVKDTGIGISSANLDKLFRKDINFSTKGTDKEAGTGLGLILCHEISEKHGGEISVNSVPGSGTTFSVYFP